MTREDAKKGDGAFMSVVANFEGSSAEGVTKWGQGALGGRRQQAANSVHQRLHSCIVIRAATQNWDTLLMT